MEKILDYYNLTATAFAEEVDFNRSTISHLLSGRNKPSLEFVMKLLQKFPEVDLNWLLYGKGTFPTVLNNLKEINTPSQKNQNDTKKSFDLFSNDITDTTKNIIHNSGNSNKIEKIVFFYSDGSFNVYQN
ncbi:helix-turn-helix transcriptional regulator [Aequorivita sp. Q41]|uniref:helix-turn-helix domain-containing protein n=1 Tax=Aequorivita sp. Q41 TaxID=3153300 RepID=UPI0032427126